MHKILEKCFKLKENKTTVKTELFAGLTTFSTMAYIIVVNPTILSRGGMDFGAVMVATILATCLATLIMGLLANYPIVVAPGLALNAYFVYTVVQSQGYTWQVALGAVFIAALIMLLLTLLQIRKEIIKAIPLNLRLAATAGIGLFLAFIGLNNAGLIVAHPGTLVTLGKLDSPFVYLTGLGVLIIAVMMVYRIRGAMLYGLLAMWIIGLITGHAEWKGIVSLPPSIEPTFLQLDLKGDWNLAFTTIVFSFLFIALFDTAGTLIGMGERGNFLNEKGHLPRISRAFSADAVGSSVGALLGTSTLVIYLESMSGILAGGRTGLTAVVVALLFLLALFFEPLASSIPIFATSPILIVIGSLMLSAIAKLDWDDPSEFIPGFLVVIGIPLTYSIALGLALGLVAYPLVKLFSGRVKQVHWLTWVLAAIFLSKFLLLPDQSA